MTPEPWVPKVRERVVVMAKAGESICTGIPERPSDTRVTIGEKDTIVIRIGTNLVRPDPVPLLRELVKKLEAAYDSPSSLKQLDLVNTVEKVKAAYPEAFQKEDPKP